MRDAVLPAMLAVHAFNHILASLTAIGAPFTPMPHHHRLELEVIPSPQFIMEAIRELMICPHIPLFTIRCAIQGFQPVAFLPAETLSQPSFTASK